MTLMDCMRQALGQHRDLAAALNRLEARRSGAGAPWRHFVPRLIFGASFDQRQEPLFGPFYSYFHPDHSVGSQALEASIGVGGELPVGTSYQLSFGNAARYYTSYTEALNPRFETALRLTLSQQLWRGVLNFYDLDEAQARLTREEAVALEQRDAILLNVAERWVDLARAQEVVQLQRESVQMARQFEELTEKLIQGGQLSRVDLALATQTVADRQAKLALAEAERELAAHALSAAIQLPYLDGTAGAEPIAVDGAPDWPRPDQTLAVATKRALAYSPVLARLRAELDVASIQTERAVDERRPDIRLRVDGNLSGLSGQSACLDGYLADGITPCGVPPGYAGGYQDTYPGLASGRFYGVTVGLEGSIPTFFGPHSDLVDERRLDARASQDELEAAERRLTWRVRRELGDVETRARLTASAQRAVELAEKGLEAEETKFRSGRSVGLAMLQTQDLVIAARLQLTGARYQLARALARLRSVLGELTPEHDELFARIDAEGT